LNSTIGDRGERALQWGGRGDLEREAEKWVVVEKKKDAAKQKKGGGGSTEDPTATSENQTLTKKKAIWDKKLKGGNHLQGKET